MQLISRMSHEAFSGTLAYVSLPTVANEEPKGKLKKGTRPIGMNQRVPIQKKEQSFDPGGQS